MRLVMNVLRGNFPMQGFHRNYDEPNSGFARLDLAVLSRFYLQFSIELLEEPCHTHAMPGAVFACRE